MSGEAGVREAGGQGAVGEGLYHRRLRGGTGDSSGG